MYNPEISILKSWEEVVKLRRYVEANDFPFLIIDTETDNKNEKLANLYGVSICFNDSEGFYIPIRKLGGESWWSSQEEQRIAAWVYYLCQNKKVIGWNIIYDVLVLERNWGFDIAPYIYADGILMKHCVDEERPFGLKDTAVKYLGPWADKAQKAMYENIEKNGGKTTKEQMDMYKADTDVLGEYAVYDVLITQKLYVLFQQKLDEENLNDLFYKDEVMPLYKEITIPMKRHGFPVDIPYFTELDEQINQDINNLIFAIKEEIKDDVFEFEQQMLDKDYPAKVGGTFPKMVAEIINFELPKNKTGGVTLSKTSLDKLVEPSNEEHRNFLAWLKGTEELNKELVIKAQRHWFFKDNPEETTVFNLRSNNHLKWLFFDKLGLEPLSRTEKGEPQTDDDFLDSVREEFTWIANLSDFKKLMKLKSTYIEGILERQIDGVIYTSMLQFGTTSGRYSSTNPNLQNLPATKDKDSGLSEVVLKYVNSIRKGFIAPPGYVLVDADQSALEPRCFASVSGDANLQKIFFNNEDMYGSIAIRQFNVPELSPFKSDPNFVGKVRPELRKQVKTYSLAVAYGAGAGRIAGLLGITREDAQKLIDDYLDAYPGLKNYIQSCHESAKKNGYVRTLFGRMRHLPRVKHLYNVYGDSLQDWRYVKKTNTKREQYEMKNGLNNATNMPIQGLAAHVMNRSMIQIARRMKQQGINGYVALQIHDQVVVIVQKEQAEETKAIVQDCLENTIKIAVPLIAEPAIALNMKDSH